MTDLSSQHTLHLVIATHYRAVTRQFDYRALPFSRFLGPSEGISKSEIHIAQSLQRLGI